MDFTDIIKFFNEMAEKHEAVQVLDMARQLVSTLQTMMADKWRYVHTVWNDCHIISIYFYIFLFIRVTLIHNIYIISDKSDCKCISRTSCWLMYCIYEVCDRRLLTYKNSLLLLYCDIKCYSCLIIVPCIYQD